MVNKYNRQCVMCGLKFNFDKFWDRGNNWHPDNNLCRTCQFWFEKFKMVDNPEVVRINREHYIIGSKDSDVKGMAGSSYKIKFNDGRVVATDNLWHQGHIPIAWQKYLKDNAKFIKETDD